MKEYGHTLETYGVQQAKDIQQSKQKFKHRDTIADATILRKRPRMRTKKTKSAETLPRSEGSPRCFLISNLKGGH